MELCTVTCFHLYPSILSFPFCLFVSCLVAVLSSLFLRSFGTTHASVDNSTYLLLSAAWFSGSDLVCRKERLRVYTFGFLHCSWGSSIHQHSSAFFQYQSTFVLLAYAFVLSMLFSKPLLLLGCAVGRVLAAPSPLSRYNTSHPADVLAPDDVLNVNTTRSDNYIVVMKE